MRLPGAQSTLFMALVLNACLAVIASGSERPLGVFTDSGDVGNPKNAGSASYDPQLQTYTLTGSGENMWADRDEFQFAWKRLKGDFVVTARGKFLTPGGQPHKKFGWIVRSSLDPD